MERKGKAIPSIHVEGPKTEKVRQPTVKGLVQGIWRLRVSEAEPRVQEGKVKTVTETRQSSACDTFIAESVYLVVNCLLDWEPVEKLKQRCEVISFTFFSV